MLPAAVLFNAGMHVATYRHPHTALCTLIDADRHINIIIIMVHHGHKYDWQTDTIVMPSELWFITVANTMGRKTYHTTELQFITVADTTDRKTY